MVRVRRTISFKPEVDKVIEDKRGKDNISKYMNNHFENEFKEEIKDKRKELNEGSKKSSSIKNKKKNL